MLTGKNIILRTVETSDSDLLLEWENQPDHWQISGTRQPFTRSQLESFASSPPNLVKDHQERYMICLKASAEAIGCIDLFQYDALKGSAGVGVLIADPTHRKKGFADEALKILIDHSFKNLRIKRLFCSIFCDNLSSLKLFIRNRFRPSGKNTKSGIVTLELKNPKI